MTATHRLGAVGLPSPAQRAVLCWLVAYPGLTIDDNGRWATWSASWRNEAARRHMVWAMGQLDSTMDLSDTRPANLSLADQGTPRCTRPTLQALYRRGWLRRATIYRRDQPVIRIVGHRYSLSAAGREVVR